MAVDAGWRSAVAAVPVLVVLVALTAGAELGSGMVATAALVLVGQVG